MEYIAKFIWFGTTHDMKIKRILYTAYDRNFRQYKITEEEYDKLDVPILKIDFKEED